VALLEMAAAPGGTVSAAATLTATRNGDRIGLAVTGAWTAENAAELEAIVDKTADSYPAVRSVDIDLAELERLDTFGAWLIERLNRVFAARGSTTRILNLPDKDRGLMEEVRLVNLNTQEAAAAPNSILAGLDRIGRAMAEIGQSLVLLAHLLGALTGVVLRSIAHPSRLRLTSTLHHFERVGWNAVPIIVLSTLLIGAILAQQGIFRFRAFGLDAYVVDMVTVLVLREVGVLIVCVMVAGRSGSAFTAELGSMKMREEIDALRTMGLDPVEVLVLPRIIAIVVAVPMLTFIGVIAALYGSGLVCWLYGGMSPAIYLERLREAIWPPSFAVGLIKAPFMALVIGLVACVEGFAVDGSAASLGMKTTASVVKSIFLVIVLDGIFAMFFASIGM
jgi:phospholipid/cholesterol/gamma-HCH transport system permease protein